MSFQDKQAGIVNSNRITLTLPLYETWLCYVEESLRRYGEHVGFSPALNDMLAGSVMEACEELIRAGKEAGVHDPFDLVLDFKGEAVVIEVNYNGRIPLNPHETEDYEVPDAGSGLDKLDMDALWLHLIKRRMDRVRFSVKGSRHALVMIKYRRGAGKEKQAWVMAVTPALKKGLILHLDDPEAEHPSSVLQAVGHGTLKLGPGETFLIRNMDGETSFHELYMAHIDALGMISPKALSGLYERLEANGMLAEPDGDALPNRFRRLCRQCLNPDLTFPYADKMVTRIHEKTRWLYTPVGLGLLLFIALSGFFPLWAHMARFREVVIGLEAFVFSHPMMLVPLYLLSLVHVMLHELGHGVTCKHYGGMVPRLGIMFYLASFIFYCDTTSSWNFSRKSHRILVSLGGPLVSFATLGAGLWVATYVPTGSLWESTMVAFCLFTAFGLVMNFNPFIKMDAYYMLLDVTGIPNLRKKSFAFLENKLLEWLGVRLKQATAIPPREKQIFWWYGVLGTVVTLAFVALPAIRLSFLLNAGSDSGGRFFFVCILGTLMVVRLTGLAFRKLKTVRCRDYSLK